MPAFSKSILLYQKPTTPTENGSAYVLPSTCQPATEPPTVSMASLADSEMSWVRPASTWSASSPPPRSM